LLSSQPFCHNLAAIDPEPPPGAIRQWYQGGWFIGLTLEIQGKFTILYRRGEQSSRRPWAALRKPPLKDNDYPVMAWG
jgi:hypothetical protein